MRRRNEFGDALARVRLLQRRRDTEALLREVDNPLAEGRLSVRAKAAHALGKIGDSRAIPTLLRLLRDPSEDARLMAVRALGHIGGDESKQAIRRALGDPSAVVRMAAADAATEIRDPAAVPSLIQLLDDNDWRVRVAVARALGTIGDRTAIEPLARARSREGLLWRRHMTRALRSLRP